MIFWCIVLAYLAIGMLVAKISYNVTFNQDVQEILERIGKDYRAPYEVAEGSEAKKLEYAIAEAKKNFPTTAVFFVFMLWPAALTLELGHFIIVSGAKLLQNTAKPASVKKLEKMMTEDNKKAELEKAYAVLREAGIVTPKDINL